MLVRNKLCFDSADLASLTRFYVPWGRGGGAESKREKQTTVLIWHGFIGEREARMPAFPQV